MQNKVKRRVNVFAVLIFCLLILSGCGQTINEILNAKDILASGNTENDIQNTEYTFMFENENLQFWMNKDTTEFKVVNKKDASEWFSTNQGTKNSSEQSAIFRLSHITSTGTLANLDSMTNSVEEGQYSVEPYKNGVRVKYSIGSFSEKLLVPYALSEERYEELLDRIEDDFEKYNLVNAYALTVLDEIIDEEEKTQKLSDFPLLKKQPLYIVRNQITNNAISKKEMAALLRNSGYTQEEYESDSKFFSADGDTEKIEPGFIITVEYEFSENTLIVRIPYDGIQMRSEFPLTDLLVLPGFGSPQEGDKGYFLLPDGSGSLMNFYNGRGSGQIYRTPVFGTDYAMAAQEKLNDLPGAVLPVFGIKTGSTGVLCEIAEGEAIAEITAHPGDKIEVPYVYPKFSLRATYKSTLTSGRKEPFLITQKQRYQGDILLRYHFLDGESSELEGMANVVRESLFRETEARQENSLPVMIEQVGLISKQNQWLGFSYRQKVALTSFEEVLSCAQAFTKKGVENLSVKLTGWFGEGINHEFISGKIKPAPALGGKSGLQKLLNDMKKEKIPLYLDADVQFTWKDKFFDGYSVSSDAISLINRAVGKAYEYDPASFLVNKSSERYINNAAAANRALENYKKTLKDWDVNRISLRSAGLTVSADFGDDPVDRQTAAKEIKNQLKSLKDSSFDILTSGANSYALPYINQCLNVPVTSGGYDNTDLSVPFLMMVIGGNISYYAPPVNLRGDTRQAILEAASAGAGLSCVLTGKSDGDTIGSEFRHLYSTDFEFWKQSLPEQFVDYQTRMRAVSGKLIIGFQAVGDEVYETVFEDGKSVIVNFGNRPYTNGKLEIGARDFIVRES